MPIISLVTRSGIKGSLHLLGTSRPRRVLTALREEGRMIVAPMGVHYLVLQTKLLKVERVLRQLFNPERRMLEVQLGMFWEVAVSRDRLVEGMVN